MQETILAQNSAISSSIFMQATLWNRHPLWISSPSLSRRALLWWVSQHGKPDIKTWSWSKAACSYPAPPAGRGSFTVERDGKDVNRHCSQAPGGSLETQRCKISLRWHQEDTTGMHLKISQTKKILLKNPAYQVAEGLCVWRKRVLFVCRVPQDPKCVKSHVWDDMRQPSICHRNFLPERSHSSSLRRKTCHTVRSSKRALSWGSNQMKHWGRPVSC